MADPPVEAGGVQVAVAVRVPPTAPWVGLPMLGSPGTLVTGGVTVVEDAEAGPGPALLMALTTKCTGTPLASPVTTVLVALGEAERSTPTCAWAASRTWIL